MPAPPHDPPLSIHTTLSTRPPIDPSIYPLSISAPADAPTTHARTHVCNVFAALTGAQICHQLRTGPAGHMDFEEVSEVVPWLELAADQGQDLHAPQPGTPRCFKTHAWREHCPKGARYIVVVRNPPDVALSFFRFFEGWFFEPGRCAHTQTHNTHRHGNVSLGRRPDLPGRFISWPL